MSNATLTHLSDLCGVDAEIVPMHDRLENYRMIAFDMDSTLITIECIDEIADYVGRKAEVAAITQAAMRGEIADYDESLRRRVALLAGLSASTLQQVYDERVRLSPGARTLIDACRGAGLKVVLVSGGFTFFTDRLHARLGFDYSRSNTLEIIDARLTGRVVGEIVNAEGKRRFVEQVCERIGCTPAQSVVVGDGANDLRMMAIAGISVAYHAKPIVHTETKHAVNHCGLDSILAFFDGTRFGWDD
ncbi:MAG: phosphoserine phosphatase SerB [Burkholderiaceae bacterium]|nr:phosphoserine phosphatase SerB [Burkholderiaceae bacterium]